MVQITCVGRSEAYNQITELNKPSSACHNGFTDKRDWDMSPSGLVNARTAPTIHGRIFPPNDPGPG